MKGTLSGTRAETTDDEKAVAKESKRTARSDDRFGGGSRGEFKSSRRRLGDGFA